jgi:hypothetical protein
VTFCLAKNIGVKISVIGVRSYSDVSVPSPNGSRETSTFMCSSNLLLHTHMLERLENEARNENFCNWVIQIICLSQNVALLLNRGCERSEGRFSMSMSSAFIGFVRLRKMHVLFDTADAVSAVGVCALGSNVGSNVAQVTLLCIFVVMIDILSEQNNGVQISVIGVRGYGCRCLLQMSPTHPRACSTNLLSHTHTLEHSLGKTS